MERAGPGPNPVFAKTWSKAFVSLRLTDTVQMEFSQAVLDCKRRDLHGVDEYCWDMRSVGEGISFLGLSRLLGVGTVYVTSLENFIDVLFGVGVASFIFRRHIAFLFHVAAAYVLCGEVFGGLRLWFWYRVRLRQWFHHPLF